MNERFQVSSKKLGHIISKIGTLPWDEERSHVRVNSRKRDRQEVWNFQYSSRLSYTTEQQGCVNDYMGNNTGFQQELTRSFGEKPWLIRSKYQSLSTRERKQVTPRRKMQFNKHSTGWWWRALMRLEICVLLAEVQLWHQFTSQYSREYYRSVCQYLTYFARHHNHIFEVK